MPLQVRPISREEHLAFIASRLSVSFLQCPSWGEVKTDWAHESLGWVDDAGDVAGAGLVLYRRLPRVPVLGARSLAYLPEGPVIDWAAEDLGAWLDPLVAYLRGQGAFTVKIGPPVVTRRWDAATVKAAIAAGDVRTLDEVPADEHDAVGERLASTLRAAGWRAPAPGHGFAAGQPQYVFQLPLSGRTLDDVRAGLNQLWRRNIRKADKAGVSVSSGAYDDLVDFHRVYAETAERDGFTPRPLVYFQGMHRAMAAEDPQRLRLYLAHHQGDLVAATLAVLVGDHAWYSYGASTTAKREVRASNAVQWAMISDAHRDGASVYDLRGITDTLDANDPHFGLVQFKLGTGGRAVEYLGEWDLPLNRVLHRAFELYLSRR